MAHDKFEWQHWVIGELPYSHR